MILNAALKSRLLKWDRLASEKMFTSSSEMNATLENINNNKNKSQDLQRPGVPDFACIRNIIVFERRLINNVSFTVSMYKLKSILLF